MRVLIKVKVACANERAPRRSRGPQLQGPERDADERRVCVAMAGGPRARPASPPSPPSVSAHHNCHPPTPPTCMIFNLPPGRATHAGDAVSPCGPASPAALEDGRWYGVRDDVA